MSKDWDLNLIHGDVDTGELVYKVGSGEETIFTIRLKSPTEYTVFDSTGRVVRNKQTRAAVYKFVNEPEIMGGFAGMYPILQGLGLSFAYVAFLADWFEFMRFELSHHNEIPIEITEKLIDVILRYLVENQTTKDEFE